MLNSAKSNAYLSTRAVSSPVINETLNRSLNPIDTFRVRLTERSSFRAELKGIKKKTNVDLELVTRQGTIVAASKKRGNKNELITVGDLNAGVYFLRTSLKRGQTSQYKLNYSSSPFITSEPTGSSPTGSSPTGSSPTGSSPTGGTPIDLAGNTPGTARSLTVGTTPTIASDAIGTFDPSDYYSFVVGDSTSPSAQVKINITGNGGGLLGDATKVTLRDGLGTIVSNKTSYDGAALLLDNTLPAGTYYVEVTPVFGSTPRVDYTMSVTSNSIADGIGNTPGTAQVISSPFSTTNFVGSGDVDDYFKFTLTGQRDFNLTLTGVNGELLNDAVRVTLYKALPSGDISTTTLASESSYDGGGISIKLDDDTALDDGDALAAGTYYLKVSSIFGTPTNFDRAAAYKLDVSTPSDIFIPPILIPIV